MGHSLFKLHVVLICWEVDEPCLWHLASHKDRPKAIVSVSGSPTAVLGRVMTLRKRTAPRAASPVSAVGMKQLPGPAGPALPSRLWGPRQTPWISAQLVGNSKSAGRQQHGSSRPPSRWKGDETGKKVVIYQARGGRAVDSWSGPGRSCLYVRAHHGRIQDRRHRLLINPDRRLRVWAHLRVGI